MKSLLLAALAAASIGATANAATLHLTLNGVEPRGGKLLVAVQARDQYMQRAMSAGTVLDGSASGVVTADIPVPGDGDFAVTVLHDVNGDLQMGKDARGRPTEGWASVNAETLRAAPTFEQVKTRIAGDTALSLHMIYPK